MTAGDDDTVNHLLSAGTHTMARLSLRFPESFLRAFHVIVPKVALIGVVGRELPVFQRVIDSLEESSFCSFLKREEKFSHHDAIPRQILLEIADVFEPLFPNLLPTSFGGSFSLPGIRDAPGRRAPLHNNCD
ncbi:MAG: hypothetical protein Udaeo2_22360 [Candidatus Udaeobacter sp.]|nr:MAG: hypothetical protein Udaeo2_22360 [Candidatus Udaeobacter sp.]